MSVQPSLDVTSSAVSPSGFATSPVLSSEMLSSSALLAWQGFSLQENSSYLEDDTRSASTGQAIRHMLSAPAPGERHTSCGCNKSIRLFQARRPITAALVASAHGINRPTAVKWIHCELEHDLVHKIAEEIDYRHDTDLPFNSDPKDLGIETIAGLLAREVDLGGISGRLYADSLAHALTVRILLLANTSGHATANACRTSSLPPRALRRVKERIEAELGDTLSLEVLAGESGYSRAHFLRMFRTATGITPYQYLLDRRVSRALDLLQQTKTPLAEIAFECGFSSQSHMTDIFRTRLGVTPAAHRRN